MIDFAKFIPGGWVVYLIIGTVLAGSAGYAGSRIQALVDNPKIAKAEAGRLDAEKNLAEERAAFDKYHAGIEKDRADANAKAFDEQKAMQNRIEDLQVRLNAEKQAKDRAAQARLEALKHVPQTDTSLLGPAARGYFNRLRDAQTAHPAPPGG